MSKILLVEDDKKLLKALAFRMRAEGYEVVTAEDGLMAVAAAVKEQPDLVILDISMPAGNGFTVAERLDENPITVDTPRIFITASRMEGLRDEAAEHGAIAYFEKPVDPRPLMQKIADALDMAA